MQKETDSHSPHIVAHYAQLQQVRFQNQQLCVEILNPFSELVIRRPTGSERRLKPSRGVRTCGECMLLCAALKHEPGPAQSDVAAEGLGVGLQLAEPQVVVAAVFDF